MKNFSEVLEFITCTSCFSERHCTDDLWYWCTENRSYISGKDGSLFISYNFMLLRLMYNYYGFQSIYMTVRMYTSTALRQDCAGEDNI